MSTEAVATLLAALVTGVFVLVQWWLSQRAGAAKRDDEMLHWGGLVIDMMAALENLCTEASSALPASEFERLRLDAVAASSALVDRGRLFFPNVQTSRQAVDPDGRAKPRAYKGYRVAILDKVITAHEAACLLNAGASTNPKLRTPLRQARREFVSLLQQEVGASQRRKARRRKAGHHVPLRIEEL